MMKLLIVSKYMLPAFLLCITKSSFAQNVGIGTNTPSAKLHVKGTGSGTQIVLEENAGSILRISNEPSGTGPYIGTTTNNPLSFVTNNSVRAIVSAAGNVGIGVLNPQQQLSVAGGAVIDQGNTNTGTSANGILSFGSLSGEGIGSKRNTGSGQWGLDFYTNNIQRMTIANNGNIGINITNPAAKLEVRGALGFSSTTKRWELNYDSTNNYFYIDEFGAARRLVIKNGGNLGINTTNPQTTLDVNGDVNIENRLMLNNSAGNSGQVLVSNGNAAPSWQNTAYGTTDRFFYFSDNDNAVISMDDDTLGFVQRYAYSSAITYNNKIFTVNKSGLYRFQGNVMPTIVTTGTAVYPRFIGAWTFSSANSFYAIMDDVLEYSGNNTWKRSKQYEFDIYLTQGSIFVFSLSATTSSGPGGIVSKYMYWSPVSINLISD